MNVPHGATHREVGTNNYYIIGEDHAFSHDGIAWGQCVTPNMQSLIAVSAPMNREEAITYLRGCGVEVFNTLINHTEPVGWVTQRRLYKMEYLFVSEAEESDILSEDVFPVVVKVLCPTLQERLTAILGVETDEDIAVHVKALHDAVQEQETAYWDGVEPLRVGHIVKGGTVVAKDANCMYCVDADGEGLEIWAYSAMYAHPLAALSNSERELVNNLIEAGVVCLPS